MKHNVTLTASALLSLFLLTIHVTDDIAHGFDAWRPSSPIFGMVLGVLLYGTLMLAERRSGLVIMLIVGLGAAGMPVIHRGAGAVARLSGGFLFIWTLIALGATGTLTVILAIRGLRSTIGIANESPDRRR